MTVRNQYDREMPQPDRSDTQDCCLVAINGEEPGATIQLDPSGDGLTVGRDETRDIALDDPIASRLHARIWHDGRLWHIEDCGSSNGTKVNSEWVERTVLEPGDLIRIGDSLLVFLTQQRSLEAPTLRPSVLAGTTSSLRMSASQRDARLANINGSADTQWPNHLLPLVYRLSKLLTQQPNLHRVAKLVADACQAATGAQFVVVWLTGRSGRLRRVARVKPAGASREWDHLLASVVMEKDEAVISARTSNEESAMAVPIPGRNRPRGAIECYGADRGTTFTQDDLDFLSAVAHQLGMAVEVVHHRAQLEQANAQLRKRLHGTQRLIGDSPAITGLINQVHRVAPTDANVLVLGESGTGKELVASSLHELSRRGAGPFVAVNCAAFNESLLESELFGHESGAFTGANARRLGQFERAHLGTIFLDEVGELSPNCQAKLLRVLEGHSFTRLGGGDSVQVDVRVVAATHRNLMELIRQGKFRDDLYYRLCVIELNLPPLRDRGEDISKLAVRFLDDYRRQLGRGPTRFSKAAAEAMANYGWPGNVRELKNAVERSVVLGCGDEVTPADLALSEDAAQQAPAMISLQEAEARHIRSVLEACDGNKTKACKVLGIGRGTLYSKLKDQD